MPTLRNRGMTLICALSFSLLSVVGVPEAASAGGVDYTLTCGITTSNWNVRGYQTVNDNSCQAVQARVLINSNGTNTYYYGAPAVIVSQVQTTFGTRVGGGGRGKYNGGWGVWVF